MTKQLLKKVEAALLDVTLTPLNDVEYLLDNFNKTEVEINGIIQEPFTNPIQARLLNGRYYQFKSGYHPRFIQQAPITIDEILKNKEKHLREQTYSFEDLSLMGSRDFWMINPSDFTHKNGRNK